MLIEHVDAIVDMRRNHARARHGAGQRKEVLANLRETGTMGGYDTAARDWSVDLNAPVAQPGKPVDVLFVAGEGAFDMRYQRTLRAFVTVLNKAGVDYAVLGATETDTGDVARRLGDEATFQQMAKRLIGTLGTLSYKQIVTADPHVMHNLRNEYRALGLRVTVKHPRPSSRSWPTAADRAEGRRSAAGQAHHVSRSVLPRPLQRRDGSAAQAAEDDRHPVVEMERNGMRGRCCGGGGGAPLTDIPGKQHSRHPHRRRPHDRRGRGRGGLPELHGDARRRRGRAPTCSTWPNSLPPPAGESMNTIKQIDPRRPFIITAAGLKRITLGEEGSADANAVHGFAHGHGAAAAKPRRAVQDPRIDAGGRAQ